MQRVIGIEEIGSYTNEIDQSVIDYIASGQIETFERFDRYDIMAFDWYDLEDPEVKAAQVLIYLDKDDLFFICETEAAHRVAERFFTPGGSNENALNLFLRALFKANTRSMDLLEDHIADLDEDVAGGTEEGLFERLMSARDRVLRAKRYCEQLEVMLEEFSENENGLLSEEGVRCVEVLHSRAARMVSQASSLREYMTQVRESYQAQIGIEQNQTMKVFTMVTSIFLPLTLIAGWYGMNLNMPESRWEHGYAFVAGLCVLVSVIWYIIFKRRKWFH